MNWFRKSPRHAGRIAVLFIGVLLPLVLFGMLAEDVAEREIFWFDRPILLFAHAHAGAVLGACMLAVTQAGSAWAMIPFDLLAASWLFRRGRRADALFWSACVVGSAAINAAAKQFFGRARPSLWVSGVHEASYSFPSGHAMSTMAAMAALCVLAWPTRWRWPVAASGAAFVLLVGASRVYLGVHYPSDIVAGWTASLAWTLGLRLAMDYRAGRRDAPVFPSGWD